MAGTGQRQLMAEPAYNDESFYAFMASCQDGGPPPPPIPTPNNKTPSQGPAGTANNPSEDPSSAARRAHFQRDSAALSSVLGATGTHCSPAASGDMHRKQRTGATDRPPPCPPPRGKTRMRQRPPPPAKPS